MKCKISIFMLLQVSILVGQNWKLKLSSNVEIVNWKLTSVADKSQKSLQGASIVLTKNGTVIEETSTNGDGDFTVMVPPNGEFLLTVSYPGYNTKRFSINTFNVPENFAVNDYKPTFIIGGFIMAKAFPNIDYSGLQKPLVHVEFKQKKKVFDHDEMITENGLAIVTKIYNDESKLIQEFCSTNKKGDAALAKPDCPLAKMHYEKAISLIPGESYPVEQLAKVGKCLKEKEETEKLANEKAEKEKVTQEKQNKQQTTVQTAVKIKTSVSVYKTPDAKALKAQQQKEGMARAKAEDEAEERAIEEKKQADRLAKQKAKEEKERKQKEGMARAMAEDEAEERAIEEKKQSDRLAKQKAKEEKERKQKEGMAKAKAEDEAEAKAEEEKRLARQKEKEALRKQTQYKEGELNMGKRNTKHGIYNVLGSDTYKENIKKADEFFKMKRWSEAKAAYEEALKVKPEDAYAKSRLEQSEKMMTNGKQ